MNGVNLTNDEIINIAVGKSRTDKNWINKEIKWSDFLKKLSKEVKTNETAAEYHSMSKDEQGKIKDKGGFVGGILENGSRKAENVLNRRLITLDIDHCDYDIWSNIELVSDYTCCIYSTHSHTIKNQRYRLIIPLNRDVTPKEYQAIARKTAESIDESMLIFDDTTYQASRLMYWQSTPKDIDYIFKYQDGPFLNADEVLAEYTFGWNDVNSWPKSEREKNKIRASTENKPQDPTTKTGYIGAFCRAYSITEVIENFLSDEYELGKNDTRYTYIKGESSNGLEVFDNNTFAFSYQDTDPISGKGACNSFDFLRLHKFSELDSGDDLEQLESKDLKSFKKMCEFVANDEKAKLELPAEDFEKVESRGNKSKLSTKRDVRFMPLGESLIEDPIRKYDFLINRLLYENAINLISGDPKTYKTFIAIDIALGVITGTNALGHDVLKKGKVLFASTEFDVRKRFTDLMKGRGIEDGSILDNIITFVYNSLDTLQWNKDLELLERVIKEYSPKLLVIDPLSYIFDGDINKNDEVGQFFKDVKLLIRKYNVSVLLVHHNNRMNELKRMNNVSGSSAITRFVDSIIYLERFEENEKQDISKSDKELDNEVKPIKLIKGQYRHGREGYKYYSINFKINKDTTEILTERYDIKNDFEENTKINPKSREEVIRDQIINALENKVLNNDKFSFNDVLAVVNNNYGISESYFTKTLRSIINKLIEDQWLQKEGKGYKYAKVF